MLSLSLSKIKKRSGISSKSDSQTGFFNVIIPFCTKEEGRYYNAVILIDGDGNCRTFSTAQIQT
jgi:hypothetical protein